MTGATSDLEKKILDIIQQDFPVCSEPYAQIAEQVDCSADAAHTAVTRLRETGVIRRIGGSFVPAELGHVSALIAASVKPGSLEAAAAGASSFDEVTHNYERQGLYNLWFTIVAESTERLEMIAESVRSISGVDSLHALPATKTFKIRVNFKFEDNDARA
jgi:DNA-binding Lrp family transcriptional regulator